MNLIQLLKSWIFILLFSLYSLSVYAKDLNFVAEIMPPYVINDIDKVTGVEADFINSLLGEIGYSYNIKAVNSLMVSYEIKTNLADGVFALLSVHPLTEFLYVSKPYASGYIHAIVRAEANINQYDPKALKGLKIGVVGHSGFEQLFPELTLQYYSYAQEGLVKLMKGEVDMILEDPDIVRCSEKKLTKLLQGKRVYKVLNPPAAEVDIIMGLSKTTKDAKMVIDKINKVIERKPVYEANSVDFYINRYCQ